jgi:23S rRNA pseudouridine2604 synthase
MRINKYLALQGHATRRGADELISGGRIFINGKQAQLGDKVTEEDTVEVKTGKRGQQKQYLYFAYNKPRGVISHSPGDDEQDVRDTLPELADQGVFPIGRLDKDSHGLMILTNDGRITDRLLNPRHEHDKEYVVKTKLPLRNSFKTQMEEGVYIEGYLTKPTKVRITGDHTFSITLTEGKKHQIRRMVVALFNEVIDLKRTRVLNIKLGTLGAGKARAIEGAELDEFLTTLGLKQTPQ